MYSFLLIILNIQGIFGCGGGGGPSATLDLPVSAELYSEEDPDNPKRKKRTTKKFNPNDVDRNLPFVYNGFDVPPETEAMWRNWMAAYKKKRQDDDDEHPDKYKHERGPGSGWPESWIGLGAGYGGAAPPPWAYAPANNRGLPEFCYQPPKTGPCSKELIRWAYSPFTEECLQFEYSGCGGNQNNFSKKEKCEQSCMKPPVNGCDQEIKQSVEDIIPG